jgi:LuxR family maltose regulon positive regulatory protein
MSLQNKNNQSLWIQPYKLICPSINRKLLKRERLLSLLDQSQSIPLTCVYSPAGFGKSTLVVNWLLDRKLPHGWYSLDINDNDPSYFANHLIYALNQASRGGCPRTLALVQQQEYSNLHSLLSKAMMEIAQSPISFFMVLDDVHTVNNPVIVEALRHWLRLLPAQIHVILCCQNEPPISLSNFRVKGQLIEIGAEQLAFSHDETHEFLKQNLNFIIPEKMGIELSEKTGGWPAAMQLVIRNARTPTDLVDASGRLGQGAYEVDEFLIHEVINQQPKKIKEFLLKICVFEQFNAQLCNSLMGGIDSESLIYELEQRQLFIFRVEGQERWYRFQDIFRDSLLKHLKHSSETSWESLQDQAVSAFLDNNLTIEAVQLGLQLKTHSVIFNLLNKAGVDLYRSGQFTTLTKLFECLNIKLIKEDSVLSLLYAWVLLATYREDDVSSLLPDQTDKDQQLPSHVLAEHSVAQAQAAINVEDFNLANSLAEQAIAHLKPDSFVSRTVIYSVMGQSALCRGELSNAVSLLKEAEKHAFENKLVQQRLWSICLISDAYAAWGKLQTALDVQQNAIDMAHDNCIEDVLHMEFLYRNRTRLFIEQGDLGQADRLLLKSEQVIEPLGNYGLLNIHVHRGQIALWRGQNEVARNLAFQVNYLLESFDYHTDWLAYANEFLLACQSSGILDFEPNFVWREKHLTCEANNHFYQHYQRVFAIYQYTKGNRAIALEILEGLIDLADRFSLRLQSLKNKILLSLWLNNEEGLKVWAAELPQLVELKPLQSLWLSGLFCHEDLSRDWPDWSVWFSHHQVSENSTTQQNENLLEKLNTEYANPLDLVTPKELQVMLLIGAGLNNDEIASSMHIAVSTVKSHIRRLYRKLNISKRSQAVQICKHM